MSFGTANSLQPPKFTFNRSFTMSRQIIIAHAGRELICGLSTDGVEQIHALVGRLQPKLMSITSIKVMSSPEQSTSQSAGIIVRRLGLGPRKFEQHGILASALSRDSDFSEILTLIRRLRDVDVVIIVGRTKLTEILPHHIGIAEIGRDVYFDSIPLKQGQAWLIDIEKKTCTRV